MSSMLEVFHLDKSPTLVSFNAPWNIPLASLIFDTFQLSNLPTFANDAAPANKP